MICAANLLEGHLSLPPSLSLSHLSLSLSLVSLSHLSLSLYFGIVNFTQLMYMSDYIGDSAMREVMKFRNLQQHIVPVLEPLIRRIVSLAYLTLTHSFV